LPFDDDHLRALGARFVHRLLHVLVLDAEAPVGDHPARVGDRRVREGLADDGDLYAVHLAHRVGREHGIVEVGGDDVLGEEVDPALEVVVHDLLDALVAERELPVRRHHVHAEQLAGVDHILALGPQGRCRPLPGVAAVEQQCAGTTGPQLLDQCGQMRESADLAVGLGGLLEVEIREGMRFVRPRFDAEGLEQMLTDQMRHLAVGGAEANVHIRLAEPDRQQLCVAVGEVEQMHVAETGQVVDLLATLRGDQVAAVEREAGGRSGRQHLQEFTTVHCLLTGDSGSSNSATRCLTCCSLSAPTWPKRGISEQRLKLLAFQILL